MPIKPSNTLGVGRYLDGYTGNARFGTYKTWDGEHGWFVEGTASKTILYALLKMSADPKVKNKPFKHVPRRKKIRLDEIEAKRWWSVLVEGEYSDRPWVCSGEYTDQRGLHRTTSHPTQVVCLVLPRQKAPMDEDAVGCKYPFNPDYDELHKVESTILQALNYLDGIGTKDCSEIRATLQAATAQIDQVLDEITKDLVAEKVF